jgi:hypothetical protein
MFGNSTLYGSCIITQQPIFCRRCILHFVVYILQILYTKFFSLYSVDCFLNSVVYILKNLYISFFSLYSADYASLTQ